MAYTVFIELNSGRHVVLDNDFADRAEADQHAARVRSIFEDDEDSRPNRFHHFDTLDGYRVQVRAGSVAAIVAMSNSVYQPGRS